MHADTALVRRIGLVAAVLGALCALVLGVLYGPLSALSSALGTLVGMANLWALATLVGFLLDKHPAHRKARAALLLVAKAGALFLVVGLLLTRPWIRGGSFMAGITVVALAIAVGGLWGATPPDAGST